MCDPAPVQHPHELTITATNAKGEKATKNLEFWADHAEPEKAIGEIHRVVNVALPERLKAVNDGS